MKVSVLQMKPGREESKGLDMPCACEQTAGGGHEGPYSVVLMMSLYIDPCDHSTTRYDVGTFYP